MSNAKRNTDRLLNYIDSRIDGLTNNEKLLDINLQSAIEVLKEVRQEILNIVRNENPNGFEPEPFGEITIENPLIIHIEFSARGHSKRSRVTFFEPPISSMEIEDHCASLFSHLLSGGDAP
jgi:hypothetical protein